MNAKRARYTTTTVTATRNVPVKEEILLVQDFSDNGEEQEYTYTTYTSAEEIEGDMVELEDEDQETLSAHDVIIDEHGNAVTIQQLVVDESNTIEEVEAVEVTDGDHTYLDITPTSQEHEGDEEGEADGSFESGGDPNQDPTDLLGLRNKTFYCSNCGNCYGAAGSLKLHMRACLRQRPEVPADERKCSYCHKVFNSVGYLKEHVMRHTGEGPRRCQRCYRKFVDDAKYEQHMATHKEQDRLEAEAAELAKVNGGKKPILKQFTCSFCSENFTVAFEQGQVKRRYACDVCRDKYSNAEQLKRHKQTIDDKREFSCERCGRKFVFEGFLQRHIPTCDGTIKRRRDMK